MRVNCHGRRRTAGNNACLCGQLQQMLCECSTDEASLGAGQAKRGGAWNLQRSGNANGVVARRGKGSKTKRRAIQGPPVTLDVGLARLGGKESTFSCGAQRCQREREAVKARPHRSLTTSRSSRQPGTRAGPADGSEAKQR